MMMSSKHALDGDAAGAQGLGQAGRLILEERVAEGLEEAMAGVEVPDRRDVVHAVDEDVIGGPGQ